MSSTFGTNKPARHLANPESAIQVFRAQGETGDKVAIAGFSVSNFGVFASSEKGVGLFATGTELAAQFEGGVKISGGCDVTGNFHAKGRHTVDGDFIVQGTSISELADRVQQVEGLADRVQDVEGLAERIQALENVVGNLSREVIALLQKVATLH